MGGERTTSVGTPTTTRLFETDDASTAQTPFRANETFPDSARPANPEQRFNVLRGYDQGGLVRYRLTAAESGTRRTSAARRIERPPINTQYSSPNYGSRRGTDIDTVVLHHTGSNNFRGDLSTLTTRNGQNSVSAHYLIAKDGTIYQLVDDRYRAWHAGDSALHGVPTDVNARSIGIEIVSDGSRGSYTERQYQALERLVPYLTERYDVPLNNLVGHKDVAIPRGRKIDPANFDFERIRRAVRNGGGEPAEPRPNPPRPEPRPPQQPTTPRPQPDRPNAPTVTSPSARGIDAPAVNLRRGARGAQVLKLQNALVELGYMRRSEVNTGPGIFGPRTQRALHRFQHQNGVHGADADGSIYGPRTRRALTGALADRTPEAPRVSLRRGTHSPQVRHLQSALVALGYMRQEQVNTGPGTFGPQTQRALHRFQHEHGVHGADADGSIYGPRTRRALELALRSDNTAPRPTRPEPRPDPPSTRPTPQRPPTNGVTPDTLARVPGSRNVSRAFKQRVIEIARRLDVNPNYLMAVMSFESRLDPRAVNPRSGATGLIQFLPSTARGLGTSTAALRNMSAERQLDYVERYLAPYRGRMDNIEDAYMAVFYPAAIGRQSSSVLFRRGSDAYTGNAALDLNRDGAVTKREAATHVRNILANATR